MNSMLPAFGGKCIITGLSSHLEIDFTGSLGGPIGLSKPIEIDISGIIPTLATYSPEMLRNAIDAIVRVSISTRPTMAYGSHDSGVYQFTHEGDFWIGYEANADHFDILDISTEYTPLADQPGAFFVKRKDKKHYFRIRGRGEGPSAVLFMEDRCGRTTPAACSAETGAIYSFDWVSRMVPATDMTDAQVAVADIRPTHHVGGAFSCQGTIGVSAPFAPDYGPPKTFKYRVMRLAGLKKYDDTSDGSTDSFEGLYARNTDDLVGVRDAYGVASLAALTLTSAAPPAPAKSYFEVFDWDKPGITTSPVDDSDLTGTEEALNYDIGISQHCVQPVAARSITVGVAQSGISIYTFDWPDLLPPTWLAVREKQSQPM